MKMQSNQQNLQAFVIFLGREGCGKSTAFTRITNASSHRKLVRCCPCNTGVSQSLNSHLHIVDPDTNECSLHYGLTHSKLNSVCVFVEFHPRISSTLISCFWESFSKLKYEDLGMVIVVITKMDYFSPGGPWPTMQLVEKDIRKLFEEEVGIDRVIFWHQGMAKEQLLDTIYSEAICMPQRQLFYNDTELMEHFGISRKTCTHKRLVCNEAAIVKKHSTSNIEDSVNERRKKVAKHSTSDTARSMKQSNCGSGRVPAQMGNGKTNGIQTRLWSEERRERRPQHSFSLVALKQHKDVKQIHQSDIKLRRHQNREKLIKTDVKNTPTQSLSKQAPVPSEENVRGSIYEDNGDEETEECGVRALSCFLHVLSCFVCWRSNK